jgi:hypothetical protein
LHQAVPAHRLVHVHGVQAGGVKAGEPHVADDHEAERGRRITEAPGEGFAPTFVADVGLPTRKVGRRPGHDDLDDTSIVGVIVPLRSQRDDLLVELDADATAHADDHPLPVHRGEAGFEVLDEITGDELQAVLRADDRFELCPFRLELLLALDLLALGCFLELGIDPGALGLIERQFGEPTLVVDRDGGAVRDRALDVVDADVVPEDRACVAVRQLDGRAGEGDE